MNHIHRKNLFGVAFLAIFLLTAPVAGQKPASQPASRPAKVKITISRKTTYVLGPVNADGTINYVAAINKMSSKGVTPENNAAIPLIKALGPDVIYKSVREQTFKILKMKPLPKKGDYFQDLEYYKEDRTEKAGTKADPETTRRLLKKAMAAPWSAKDYPIIADWLKANEKPLALVVAASKRPQCYIPSLSPSDPPGMVDILLPCLFRFRSTAKALTARAMLKAGSGDVEAARADLMVIHRLARLIGQGPTLVDRLVAVAIEALACDADTKLATSGKLTATQANAHLADLLALPSLPGVTESLDYSERFFFLDSVMLLARKGMPGLNALINALTEGTDKKAKRLPDQRLPLDWDLILVKVNKRYDRLSASMRKKSFPERKRATAVFVRDLEKLKIRIGAKMASPEDWKQWERRIKSLSGKPTPARQEASETMADLLVSVLMPTLGRASEIYDQAIMRRRMAEVALALAACKADIGRYPVTLSVLKPHYLKKIPNDLFIGKPLHYKRTGEGYLLYSVGRNMKDNGGKGRDDGKDCDDIVVRAK